MEENEKQMTAEEKAKKLKKQRVRQMIVSLIGVGILVWGIIEVACMFLDFRNNETSNDAQVEQYLSPVNLRATGYIKKIYFTEHQDVKKGDTLLVLDDSEYRIRVMEAEAALKDAMAGKPRWNSKSSPSNLQRPPTPPNKSSPTRKKPCGMHKPTTTTNSATTSNLKSMR